MNILVISSNLIGDSILSTGAIYRFVQNYPNSSLTIISGPTAAQVYLNFPNLKKIIIVKKQRFAMHWLYILKKCIFKKWDIIIDFRSSILSYFLFRKHNYIFKGNDNMHKVNQITDFFKFDNIAYPIIFNNKFEENMVIENLSSEKIYIVVSPGGNWTPKIWSTNYYNELLVKLLNKYKNLSIILVGSTKEKNNYKETIIKNINENQITDLMGANITQTYAFMKKSNLFIGNDSGLMHLAAASGIPTIGLFGPTNDKLYSPYGDNSYIIRTKETYNDFKKIKINKNKSYMHSISIDDVIKLIEKNKIF